VADNTTQGGSATIAADDVTTLNGGASSGVLVQRMKVDYGDDGSARDVSTAFPLPVNLAASQGNVSNTSGTLAAAINSAVTATVGASGNGTIVVFGGTFTNLPIAFEASVDGTNYFAIDVTRVDGYQVLTGLTLTGAGIYAYNFMCPGYSNVRVRVTAAGTVTTAPSVIITQGPFLYDPSPSVSPIDSPKGTYVASVTGMSTTIASDVFRLVGSASRTVRVTAIEVACTTGGATNSRIQLIKRTTANSGGTTSTATVGAYDSTDPAATATANGYTAAPTLGNAGPTVGNGPAFTAAAGSFSYAKTWGARPSKALVLRGTGESLCVNNAVAIGTSGSWTITVEWTEE
jgi:hypothetical protein